MKLLQHSQSFSSILLLLGFSQALLAEKHQVLLTVNSNISISGTVGQFVRLPFPFRFCTSVPNPLTIKWTRSGNEALGSFTGHNCSVRTDWGNHTHCAESSFNRGPHHQGRVELDIEMLSLILRDLRLNDSGDYVITVNGLNKPGAITLSVTLLPLPKGSATTSEPTSPTATAGSNEEKHTPLLIIFFGVCSVLLVLFLLLLFCNIRRRGVVQSKKIIRQAEVPSADEHTPDLLPFGHQTMAQSQNVLELQSMYATLNFPARANS
ncbi:uncharacterized protein LOC103171087 [Ornithorhynchus anatinus]|uniref:uncharacterized protein LOC103171087 n=1 Tax=Ornithorhynchus anatinus TaxID=9258 RepID=UPI0010A8907C|nr:uncharacterized protein LOC103171087 [Ornithorhynchus anatinus]